MVGLRAVLLAVLVVLVTAASAQAFDAALEAANYSKQRERFAASGEASAGYQSQLALQSLAGTVGLAQLLAGQPGRNPVNPCSTDAELCAGDVRLYDWAGRYGVVRAVHYVNRNGATISGHVWAPLGRPPRAGLPAVVIVNGDLATEQLYWWAAQSLARAGYVVMTFDPQGHGRSDTFGSGADATRGVFDQQTMGGFDQSALDADAAEQTTDALDFLLSSDAAPYTPARSDGAARQRALAAAGTVDRSNPLRALVDARRVGLAGHSRGADAVSIVGTRDRRVHAIVAWDYLLFGDGSAAADPAQPLAPRVPALDMSADYYIAQQPYSSDPDRHSKDGAFEAYRRAGRDVMELVVRGGTHFEWSFVPNPAFGATLRGIDMAAWYTRAWLDRHLKGDRRAIARLLSARWRDDGAEAGVDPAHDGNMFSFYYPSRVALHVPAGRRSRLYACDDLRAGCRGLVARSRDGYPGDYSYLTASR